MADQDTLDTWQRLYWHLRKAHDEAMLLKAYLLGEQLFDMMDEAYHKAIHTLPLD